MLIPELAIRSEPTLTTVSLVGAIVQCTVAFLLMCVFAMLIPLHSQRRAVVTWLTVFASQCAFMLQVAILALFMLIDPNATRPGWLYALQWLDLPARAVFATAIGFGTFQAAGRLIAARTFYRAIFCAAMVGLFATAMSANAIFSRVYLIGMVFLVFVPAQAIFARAQGIRRRGLIFLGLALTLYGVLSTVYLLTGSFNSNNPRIAELAGMIAFSSGYGDALALAILGASVMVIIVQEAFLESTQAQEERILSIAASETRLNGIIQAAQEAIVTVGLDGKIELVNDAVEAMIGLPRDQILGHTIDEFLVDPSLTTTGMIANGAATGMAATRSGNHTHLGRGRRADGNHFALEFTVGPLRGEGRSGAVIVLHDLTERNSAQAERERFERRVAESEKMMAIGRVVSGVAHELNNPLAVVLGQSEQLADSTPSGEVQAGLRLIHEHAHRARHIVKDLLSFVRKNEDAREIVNLSRLAERTVAAQRSVAMMRTVALTTDIPPDVAGVLVERAAVEQVLVNLIDNAIDAAGTDGSVRVIVRANGDHVDLVVEDSGRGVADEHVTRIFEPFFTTKGPGRGTGLGLPVSHGIAEQHGGTLRLENRPGGAVGARFVLSIPAVRDSVETPTPPRAVVRFPGPPQRTDGLVSEVMLIDDEAGVRATLGRMFKRTGWSVREAANGDDALAWLTAVSDIDAPAIILCDIRMPGMNGHQLHEELMKRRPALLSRLIFVTGDVVESVASGFAEAAGQIVVEKPFTVEEIADVVAQTLAATHR